MNRWPWLLVLLGSILLFLAVGDRRLTRSPEPPSVSSNEPDLYMAEAAVTQYSDDGTVRYRLRSNETTHFESDGTTRLVSPTLTLNRTAPQPPWSATAKQGLATYRDTPDGKREEVVQLSEDVRLEQREPPNPIELTCPSLQIYPDRQFAETDQPVMIKSNSGSTSAVGLVGDLNTGLFKVSSSTTQRVHTVVMPDQFKPAPAQSPH